MMAHIRYATQGEVTLENVHPFVRVWKGIQMCFAHNGECPQYGCSGNRIALVGKAKQYNTPSNVPFHPVGDTDSEAVFCAILNAMSAEFPDGLPTLPVLHEFLQEICNEIVQQHEEHMKYIATIKNESIEQQMPLILNFLLGCGPYTLFAFSMPGKRPGSKVWNGLHYIVRQPPFTTAKLVDDDYMIDFDKVTTTTDRVAVIATVPLTTEHGWTEFNPGQLILFDNGIPHITPESCYDSEYTGHGLVSKTVAVKYTQLKKQRDTTKTTSTTTTTTCSSSGTGSITSPPTNIQKQQQCDADEDEDSNNSQSERRDDDSRIHKQQQQTSSLSKAVPTMSTSNETTNINTKILQVLTNNHIDSKSTTTSPSSSITDLTSLHIDNITSCDNNVA
jgi:predicted glutamine amidotransferase